MSSMGDMIGLSVWIFPCSIFLVVIYLPFQGSIIEKNAPVPISMTKILGLY